VNTRGETLISLDELHSMDPYSLESAEKNKILSDHLYKLTRHHYKYCLEYKKIFDAFQFQNKKNSNIEDFSFLPVDLFKKFNLLSVPKSKIIKTLTSSGTTSQQLSKIYLDNVTSKHQTKALSNIIQHFIGPNRLPMIIVDSKKVIQDRNLFSARGGGILGMSHFGRDHFYLLDDCMKPDFKGLEKFLLKYNTKKIFMFGFTFMVWKHFYKESLKKMNKFDLSNCIMIHSGGWKKLIDESVSNEAFKVKLYDEFKLSKIHNFYGMVEQMGSVFLECEQGHMHTSIYSDIIVRDKHDWKNMGFNQKGVIETISVLPYSYPGHVVLTEDIGEILGEDNCLCGLKGKYFKVYGRVKKAEIRGCSDTYQPEGN